MAIDFENNRNAVHLGEVVTTSRIDCNDVECADPVQVFKPAKIVVPKVYGKNIYKHDIGLIQLDRAAALSGLYYSM